MAKFDIESLISKFTNDGKVDYAKVNEELETQNRNIVVKEASKEVEKIKGETLSTIIKELGVDGETVDDLKLYIKQVSGSTDEAKEEVIKLTKQLQLKEKEYGDINEKLTKFETETKERHQTELIKKLGITDEKQVEFFKWDFNRKVTEEKTFDDVVSEWAKENDVKTTTKVIKDPFGYQDPNELDIGSVFKAKREQRKK